MLRNSLANIICIDILVGDARELWKSESEPSGKCVCTLEKGCDEACLNRCVYYECNDENCNVGPEHCQNRQFAQLKKRVMKKTKFAEGVEVVEVGLVRFPPCSYLGRI